MKIELLGHITETVMGQAPPGKDCNKTGQGTVFVKAGEFNDRFPLIKEWTTNPQKLAQEGDVLVCVVGATAGKVNQGISCAIGRSVAAIRPNPSLLDTGYLYHFLSSQTTHLRARSQGLAQGVITREMLHELKVPLPQLDEQRRIAAILDRAAALRAKRCAAIESCDALAQAIFAEMFSKVLSDGDRVPLATLALEFRYGTSNKSASYGYTALRIPNVIGGGINLSELKLVPVEQPELDRLRLHAGDVLFVRTNGNPDYVGRCAVFNPLEIEKRGHDPSDWIFASYLIRARAKREKVNPVYLREFLSTGEGRKALRERSKTSAGQFNINTEGLGSIPIPLPSIEHQDEYARCVTSIEPLKEKHESSLAKLEKLFLSLQYQAFKGEL